MRQTVSKWEQGLSVPDSDVLIRLAEVLDTRVSTLLGESAESDSDPDRIEQMVDKLEALNQEFAKNKERKRKISRAAFFALGLLCLFPLMELLFLYGSILLAALDQNASVVGVIGGADGPTALFVTSRLTGLLMHARLILPPVAGLIIAIWGIWHTKP